MWVKLYLALFLALSTLVIKVRLTQLDLNLMTYLRLEADLLEPDEEMISKVARLYKLSYQELMDLQE